MKISSTNKSLLVLSLTAALCALPMLATAQSAPQAKTCLFYEHFNYGGEHFGLYEGDVLVTAEGVNADPAQPGAGKRALSIPNGPNASPQSKCHPIAQRTSPSATAWGNTQPIWRPSTTIPKTKAKPLAASANKRSDEAIAAESLAHLETLDEVRSGGPQCGNHLGGVQRHAWLSK